MSQTRPLTRFLLIAATLYLGWYFMHLWLIKSQSYFDLQLCQHIASASAGVLRLLGFTSGSNYTVVWLQQIPAVRVGWQCNGLSLMVLFAGFIIAYPGPWRAKLWFIPAGMLAIHFINILRVVALALNQYYSRSTMEFNHHYTFSIIVYAFIFWFWTIWVRRYAGGNLLNRPTAPTALSNTTPEATPANA